VPSSRATPGTRGRRPSKPSVAAARSRGSPPAVLPAARASRGASTRASSAAASAARGAPASVCRWA